MNKVLRTALVAVMGLVFTVAAKAQAVGDLVTVDNTVYKVVSENLIANPGFEDGFTGWTSANDFATEVTAAKFALQTEDGHGNFLVGTVNEGGGAAGSLGTAWAIDADKTYYFAYDVKSINDQTGEAQFLVSSLTDNKGDETSVLGRPQVTPGQWTAFQTVFTNDQPFAFAQVKFRWLSGNFGLDNFRLMEVVPADYTLVAAAYEAANETWRAANAQITKWENEYAGVTAAKVGGKTVQEVMDAANLAIKEAAESVDANSDIAEVSAAIAAIDAALVDVEAALAAAEKMYKALVVAAELPDGAYFIQENASGKFMAPGNNWGTRASLMEHSVEWVLKMEDGKFSLESVVNNGGENYYFGGTYCDSGKTLFTIDKVGEGLYTITSATGAVGVQSEKFLADNAGLAAAQFKIKPADATKAQKGDDITYAIKDADFGRNNRYGSEWKNNKWNDGDKGLAWTKEANNLQLCGGTNDNKCAESWRSAFTLSQDLTVPNGYYTLTAQAAITEYTATGKDLAYVYANDYKATFNPMTQGENALDQLSTNFANGMYKVTLEVKVADGKLKVGAKGTRTDTWCVWDNFGLVYHADDATAYDAVAKANIDAAMAALEADLAAAITANATPEFRAAGTADALTEIKTDTATINADIKATTAYGEFEADLLAAIKAASDKVAAYVAAGQKLVDDNTAANAAQDAAYEALVAQWQDAYDKINTEYKEYVGTDPEKFQSYLSSLSNTYLDIEALGVNIETFKLTGTAVAKAEYVATTIADLSAQITAVVETALNTYEDEIATTNAAAKKALDDKAAEKIQLYKDAIVKISEHYAEFHPEVADDAQAGLFAIFQQIMDIKNAYTAEYAALEAQNKEDFEAENFPLAVFDNTAYMAALEAVDATQIDAVLAAAETAAAADNDAAYTEYHNKALNLDAAYAAVDFYQLDATQYAADKTGVEDLINKFKDAVEANKVHGFHAAVEADPNAEPPVEAQAAYWTCLFENKAQLDADYAAADKAIKDLQAKLTVDQNAANLLAVNAAADAASARLTAETAKIDTYDEAIGEALEADIAAIEAAIAKVKEDAAAADAAGTLLKDTKDALIAKIGDPNDVTMGNPVVDNSIAIADEKVTVSSANKSYKDYNSGAYTVNGLTAYKAGTSSAAGTFTVEVPAGAKFLQFNAGAWKGENGTVLAVTNGETELFNKGLTAYEGLAGNGPAYTISDPDNESAYVVEFEAALAEATTLTFTSAKRLFVWDLRSSESEPAAAPNTIYQDINKVAHVALNEHDNNLLAADVAATEKALADAKAVADELTQPYDNATIAAEITGLKAAIKVSYEASTLPADKAGFDVDIVNINNEIANALSVVYKADLAVKMTDLKTSFNAAFAELTEIDAEIDKEDLWAQIETEQAAVDALGFVDAAIYKQHADAIANIGLQFTDYTQWIVDNTKKGDANLDGEVTISDVVKVVGILVNTDNIDAETGELKDIDLALSGLTQREFYAADANDDKKIDGADLALVVDLMLGKEVAEPAAAVRAEGDTDYLVLDGNDLALVNTREYVNFTLVVSVADGAALNNVETTARTAGMDVKTSKFGNFYKILVCSADNSAISGNEGSILNLGAEGITITDAQFVAGGQTYTLGVDDVTAIRGINADGQYAEIYTVAGAKAGRLQKGVNVVRTTNGAVKKVLVK